MRWRIQFIAGKIQFLRLFLKKSTLIFQEFANFVSPLRKCRQQKVNVHNPPVAVLKYYIGHSVVLFIFSLSCTLLFCSGLVQRLLEHTCLWRIFWKEKRFSVCPLSRFFSSKWSPLNSIPSAAYENLLYCN